MTRMGHNKMLAELEQSGCQHLTSSLIAKGPTCVAKRRNGKSPTGQLGTQVGRAGAEGVRADLSCSCRVGCMRGRCRRTPAAARFVEATGLSDGGPHAKSRSERVRPSCVSGSPAARSRSGAPAKELPADFVCSQPRSLRFATTESGRRRAQSPKPHSVRRHQL